MVIHIKDVIQSEFWFTEEQFKKVLNECINKNDFTLSFEGIKSMSNNLAIVFNGYDIEMVDCSEGRKLVYEENKKWIEKYINDPEKWEKFLKDLEDDY